jgi:hypothetical protein
MHSYVSWIELAEILVEGLNYSKEKPLRLVVFTDDIEEAFNNTHPKLLTQIMYQRQMPQYLIQWAKSYIWSNHFILFRWS